VTLLRPSGSFADAASHPERGQAIILVVVMLGVLLGAAAIVIDVG
jgi:hypothetical protein